MFPGIPRGEAPGDGASTSDVRRWKGPAGVGVAGAYRAGWNQPAPRSIPGLPQADTDWSERPSEAATCTFVKTRVEPRVDPWGHQRAMGVDYVPWTDHRLRFRGCSS